ncbi:cholinesterase-like [Elgaria multicarinata webbii]|uniref:cholinesterase-like n=1 Tax=Elgaria multicarinata webbii TaxID=159646 RepID=UPI002FCCC19A
MPGFHLSSVLCFFIVFLFSVASSAASEDDTVVITSSGPIKGKQVHAGSSSVTAYLGIPYAEPPMGKLRFQKPLPHQPWSQVLEATSFGNACPQFIFTNFPEADLCAANRPLSEDCLFLNIWVPHPRPSSPTLVLAWIHGGSGFLTGTASLDMYNGAFLAAYENVVVVSINYRLGALGFLSLPPDVPGNMGLMDQQLALKWVQENAAAFGGDPTRVTIFGQNAGAASVGLHLLSPSSQSLFARVVLQSGTPNMVWAWRSPEEAKQRSLAFGHLLGCTEDGDAALLSCLQEKDAKEFGQHELSMTVERVLDIPFLPVTDGEFLPDEPQKLLEAGRIQHKPVLIGVTSDEASAFVPYFFPHVNDGLITWEQLLKATGMMVQNPTEKDVQAVALKYSEEDSGPGRYRWAMSQSFSDYFFVCPAAEFAAKVREAGNPLYFYSFRHHTSGSVWPEWVGAPHGAEIPYVFGTLESVLGVNQTYTEAEAALSRRMMHYWAEFSRTGKPTGSGASEEEWPLYNATQLNFFHLDTEPSPVTQRAPLRHCGFLKEHLAKPNKSGVDPVSPGKEGDGESESSI